MTKDRSCSSEEALQAGQERARAVYCVIRNIWTILKHRDGQRRWNVISSHSWLEERRLWLLMSTCGTAAAIQHKPSLLSRAQLKARARAIRQPRPNTVTASGAEINSRISTWFTPMFSHRILFQPHSRRRKWYIYVFFSFDLTTLIWLIT